MAELKAALQGKAGVDDSNMFTNNQIIRKDVIATAGNTDMQLVLQSASGNVNDDYTAGITFYDTGRHTANLYLNKDGFLAQKNDSYKQENKILTDHNCFTHFLQIQGNSLSGSTITNVSNGMYLVSIMQGAGWDVYQLGILLLTTEITNCKIENILTHGINVTANITKENGNIWLNTVNLVSNIIADTFAYLLKIG